MFFGSSKSTISALLVDAGSPPSAWCLLRLSWAGSQSRRQDLPCRTRLPRLRNRARNLASRSGRTPRACGRSHASGVGMQRSRSGDPRPGSSAARRCHTKGRRSRRSWYVPCVWDLVAARRTERRSSKDTPAPDQARGGETDRAPQGHDHGHREGRCLLMRELRLPSEDHQQGKGRDRPGDVCGGKGAQKPVRHNAH